MAAASHHRGKVLFLSRPRRLRLMVVEQGTASRWWELLGSVGTHWLFLFAFCSLVTERKKTVRLWEACGLELVCAPPAGAT